MIKNALHSLLYKLPPKGPAAYCAFITLLLPTKNRFLDLAQFYRHTKICVTRDLPGLALVITFFMTLFTVYRKSNFLLELPFDKF